MERTGNGSMVEQQAETGKQGVEALDGLRDSAEVL